MPVLSVVSMLLAPCHGYDLDGGETHGSCEFRFDVV